MRKTMLLALICILIVGCKTVTSLENKPVQDAEKKQIIISERLPYIQKYDEIGLMLNKKAFEYNEHALSLTDELEISIALEKKEAYNQGLYDAIQVLKDAGYVVVLKEDMLNNDVILEEFQGEIE